jgi:hypothetical protein
MSGSRRRTASTRATPESRMMALLGQQDVVNPVSFAGVPSSALRGLQSTPRLPRDPDATSPTPSRKFPFSVGIELKQPTQGSSSFAALQTLAPSLGKGPHHGAQASTSRGTSLALRCRFEGACINLVEDSARRVVRRASHNAPRAPGAASVCQRRAWSDACEAALGTIGRWTTRRSVALIIGGFFGSVLAPLCRRHISKQEQVAGCTRANTRLR